jgi:NADH-quinone oxidoreductase subunit N
MLVGLAVGDPGGSSSGLTALWFYLVTYGVTTVGVFALLAGADSGNQSLRTDADLAGLSKTRPILAALLAVCLFSLSGLPPTAGFLGKLNLFLAAWNDHTSMSHWLAILLAVNAVIAASYYLRLVSVIYLQEPARDQTRQLQIPAWIAGGLCTAVTLALFAVPQSLWNAALHATR